MKQKTKAVFDLDLRIIKTKLEELTLANPSNTVNELQEIQQITLEMYYIAWAFAEMSEEEWDEAEEGFWRS